MPPIVNRDQRRNKRPVPEVFACATDPARFSEWQEGVVEGHMDLRHPAFGARSEASVCGIVEMASS